jgi:hypothetical protein
LEFFHLSILSNILIQQRVVQQGLLVGGFHLWLGSDAEFGVPASHLLPPTAILSFQEDVQELLLGTLIQFLVNWLLLHHVAELLECEMPLVPLVEHHEHLSDLSFIQIGVQLHQTFNELCLGYHSVLAHVKDSEGFLERSEPLAQLLLYLILKQPQYVWWLLLHILQERPHRFGVCFLLHQYRVLADVDELLKQHKVYLPSLHVHNRLK